MFADIIRIDFVFPDLTLLASLAIFIASNRMINVASLPGLMSRHPQIRFECEMARKQIIYCAVTGVILKIKYNTAVILGIKEKSK